MQILNFWVKYIKLNNTKLQDKAWLFTQGVMGENNLQFFYIYSLKFERTLLSSSITPQWTRKSHKMLWSSNVLQGDGSLNGGFQQGGLNYMFYFKQLVNDWIMQVLLMLGPKLNPNLKFVPS